MTHSRRNIMYSLAALIGGLALGLTVLWAEGTSAALDGVAAAAVRWIEPVGLLWVNAIRMTVIPLVVASLIVAVADANPRTMGRLGARAFLTMFLLLSTIAAMTAFVAPPVFAQLTIDADAAASLRSGVGAGAALPKLPSFTSWLVSIVPVNPIAAAAEGSMLPLVVFTLALGLALGSVTRARRDAVVDLFRGVADAIAVLVAWILKATPYGVFSLAFVVAVRIGTGVVHAVAFYIVAYSALLVVGVVMTLLAVALFAKVPFRRFARAALPAQVVAMTTRSSMASLPAMAAASDALKLEKTATSFALPLAVSTFRLNQAVSWVVMALFAAKLYGVELGGVAIATLAVTSVLMSFSVPGIPSASLFVVAPFFAGYGIPAEAIGVLIALDLIPDVFKTLLNVSGQLGVVTIIGAPPLSPEDGKG